MPKKAARKKTGKTTARTAKKTAKKKPLKKKTAVKKKPTVKKTAGKAAKKKAAAKKIAQKKTVPRAKKQTRKKPAPRKSPAVRSIEKPLMVEPGPQPMGIPPVEEPSENEEALGVVTHYYSHIVVAVVQLNKGTLRTGDLIHLKGHSTDFRQKVESMEYEHLHIDQASAGQNVEAGVTSVTVSSSRARSPTLTTSNSVRKRYWLNPRCGNLR